MSDCEDGTTKLRKRTRNWNIAFRQQQGEIKQLRHECEWKVKELKWEFQTKMETVRKERSAIEEQLQTLDALIEKRKGSLCEWLEKNKPDWQETIGKVADEELVLYNNELQPQLVNKEATLFGVSLNLTAIERFCPHSPRKCAGARQATSSPATLYRPSHPTDGRRGGSCFFFGEEVFEANT